jgi:hypothetical protein
MKPTKCKMLVTSGVLIISFLSLVILLVGQISAQDKDKPSSPEASKLAKDLIGTWILVGTPDEVGEIPDKGGRLKFITGRHWTITQADPNTGLVIFHHGGTYTLDGNEYVEKIEYANENTKQLINKTLKHKIKVEKDTYTQIGVGNPYTEVWKRLK